MKAFTEEYPVTYSSRGAMWNCAFPVAKTCGVVLEFGVYTGGSLNAIANYFSADKVFGFDTFTGVEEDWVKSSSHTCDMKKFDVKGKLPSVPSNVSLEVGLFVDTIPIWKEKHLDNIKLLHIDSDTYSAAKTIFTDLNDRIVPGTVIIFDELYGANTHYKYWKQHEYKAFNEWLHNCSREAEPIARTKTYEAAILVTK